MLLFCYLRGWSDVWMCYWRVICCFKRSETKIKCAKTAQKQQQEEASERHRCSLLCNTSRAHLLSSVRLRTARSSMETRREAAAADLAPSTFSQVVFTDTQYSYPPSAPIICRFTLNAAFQPNSRDWVGIFKVGRPTVEGIFLLMFSFI